MARKTPSLFSIRAIMVGIHRHFAPDWAQPAEVNRPLKNLFRFLSDQGMFLVG